MIKKVVSTIFLVILISSLTSCKSDGKTQTRYEAEFLLLFDTATRIVGYADSEEEFTEYAQNVYDNLKEYHELYDIYNDYEGINNIKTINDNAGIAPVKVDEKIIDLLKFAIEEYKVTDGKTNIAFGSVLKIWHEYRNNGVEDPKNAKLPSIDELKIANEHTNIEDIIINEDESTVFLKDSEMSLDVGAIAKGYAAGEVSKIVKEAGLTSGLLSVGGNVIAISNNISTGEDWNVGVQNPDINSQESILKIVTLKDKSLVTSGNYERYYTVDGKKYNHIINSETLFPSEYFASVSIICDDSGKADSLSTAIFSMPYEEGIEIINNISNTEAMWVFSDKTIKYSENFELLIKE
ncbi:FAD:protein FMN transferase [Sedimentibacter sp. MB31-C6]|uniref:FAD:protein FMN transferase n=1 Tax=Sedimentibacter sp. MB31-C6 TaxID=3109366 RepID=UPI002DDD861C|nr:FAD:protein FMN transferase [Sedimentibacter sp. MB36-C1]WSI05265.1 FAD:protein FMN transferase [Sedimentibacter sp. MB36-C1]